MINPGDLARIFVVTGQTVLMKTQSASSTIDLTTERTPLFNETLTSANGPSDTAEKMRRTSMRDALSFSICFAVVMLLTGAMLLYRVAVTVSAVTSTLFYISLAGMAVFAVRAILLARHRVVSETSRAELN